MIFNPQSFVLFILILNFHTDLVYVKSFKFYHNMRKFSGFYLRVFGVIDENIKSLFVLEYWHDPSDRKISIDYTQISRK